MDTLILNGHDLTLQDVYDVAYDGRKVEIAADAYARLAKGREIMQELSKGANNPARFPGILHQAPYRRGIRADNGHQPRGGNHGGDGGGLHGDAEPHDAALPLPRPSAVQHGRGSARDDGHPPQQHAHRRILRFR